jgi:hypothetical protein
MYIYQHGAPKRSCVVSMDQRKRTAFFIFASRLRHSRDPGKLLWPCKSLDVSIRTAIRTQLTFIGCTVDCPGSFPSCGSEMKERTNADYHNRKFTHTPTSRTDNTTPEYPVGCSITCIPQGRLRFPSCRQISPMPKVMKLIRERFAQLRGIISRPTSLFCPLVGFIVRFCESFLGAKHSVHSRVGWSTRGLSPRFILPHLVSISVMAM